MMGTRAHALLHVPFEGLGSIEPWLRAAGCELGVTRLHAPDPLPQAGDVDLLVVMGGPMSVNDESAHPWLAQEKRFIRQCIDAGRPVLGVCLGAQLIAAAMGARVHRARAKEIGWFPVEAVPAHDEATFRFPPRIDVFHWHGETFELPPGALRLARSAACENQAFQLGRSVIGLQFHLEASAASVREMIAACRDELVPSEFVQPEERILGAAAGRYRAINDLMSEVLAFLVRRADRDGA